MTEQNHADLSEKKIAAFYARVDKTSSELGCWLWLGAKVVSAGGGLYGRYSRSAEGYYADGNQKHMLAHRYAYELHKGRIPAGMTVDHFLEPQGLCTTLCCNPDHLRLATLSEQQRHQTQRVNNSSGVTGVCWDKSCGKWRARIRVAGKPIYLGLFDVKADAGAAVEAARLKHWDDDPFRLDVYGNLPEEVAGLKDAV
jgi:hypothetical protein